MVLNPREVFEYNFEQKEKPLSRDEQFLYDRFEKKAGKYTLSLDDFLGTYNQEEIAKDREYLKGAKERYGDTERHDRAILEEHMFFDQIERSGWLGEDTFSMLTTEYDDVANGVDLVVEYPDGAEEEGGHMALAIDITTGADAAVDKVQRIRSSLRDGKSSRVKYFESQSGRYRATQDEEPEDYKGKITDVPKVVLGIDTHELEILSKEMAEILRKDPEGKITFPDMQRQFLEMIVSQAEFFADDLASRPIEARYEKRRDKMIEAYRHVARHFRSVLHDQKFQNIPQEGRVRNAVYDAVQNYISEETQTKK